MEQKVIDKLVRERNLLKQLHNLDPVRYKDLNGRIKEITGIVNHHYGTSEPGEALQSEEDPL